MKVLFLHQFDLDLAGGSGTYLRLVAAGLAAAGHEVEVVSARRPDRYGLTTYALPFDFRLTFGPQRRPGERTFEDFSTQELAALSARAADEVDRRAFCAHPGPDLLLANHISLPASVAHQLSALHGVPYRIISYGTDTQLLERDRRYVEWLHPAVRDADRVFAISRFVAAQVRGTLPDVAVDVLGGAVDTRIFHPGPRNGNAERVAFVGRLVTEKGVWTLLDALERLDGRVAVDLVGEGPLLEPLRDAAARLGAGRKLDVLGYLPPPQVRRVLLRSAVAVVPSVWEEPLGLVALEALACGVPVVASAVGGLPEIVKHGRNGLLVEPGDGAGLARAIASVLDDPRLRADLRAHCLSGATITSHTDLAARVLR